MEFVSYLAAHPFALIATCLVLGLTVGSFLNVVIYRLPVMMEQEWRSQCAELLQHDGSPEVARDAPPTTFNLILPNSHCPHCNHELRAWENIPLLSYIALRGRCSSCDATISPRYPIVELFTGVLSAIVAWKFGMSWALVTLLLFTWALLAASVIDLDHMLLPDDITLPLLWAGLIVNSQEILVPLQSALWGAVVGYLSLWTVYWGFRLLTGKEGMGHGDFKLLAAIGAWLGWQQLPVVLLLSSLAGAVLGVTAIVTGLRERDRPIPFGPYLAAGGWICAVWSTEIQSFWLGG